MPACGEVGTFSFRSMKIHYGASAVPLTTLNTHHTLVMRGSGFFQPAGPAFMKLLARPTVSIFTTRPRPAPATIKGVVDWFFSRLDCVYWVQSSMCSCLVFLKMHYFSHNLPLFHTSLSLSDKRLDLFPGLWSSSFRNTRWAEIG